MAPLSAGASARVGTRTLDEPGESATLGSFENDPEVHVHPQWRLILPKETNGTYEVSFRLSATGFTDSPVYTVLITNEEPLLTPTATAELTATEVEEATPTPTEQVEATPTATEEGERTPTATEQPTAAFTATATVTSTATGEPTSNAASAATASPTGTEAPPVCPGDCDGNGVVAINELIRAVVLASSSGTAGCAAADGNGDRAIAINELIRAVRSALEGC